MQANRAYLNGNACCWGRNLFVWMCEDVTETERGATVFRFGRE
jgi:hypothetical protein